MSKSAKVINPTLSEEIKSAFNNGKVLLGRRKEDNALIYLYLPKWDCGWYWGFGYIGNSREHSHLDSYQAKEQLLKLENGEYKMLTEKGNISMWDALKKDYDLNPCLDDNTLYVFCELVLSIYTLRESAELFGRGGSHMTTNPCKKLLTKKRYSNTINEKLIPELCNELFSLFLNKNGKYVQPDI